MCTHRTRNVCQQFKFEEALIMDAIDADVSNILVIIAT